MARRNQTVAAEEEAHVTTDEATVAIDEQEPENREMTFDDRVEARAKELFEKWKAEEAAKKSKGKQKPEKRKHDLPEGYIAPVAFRHALVERGLAAESMSPVQIYSLARKASSNGMPIVHFDKDGKSYDEIQMHPVTREVLTRPGLKLDEGLAWWQNRPKRAPGQKKSDAENTETEHGADEDTDLEDQAAFEADSDDEGFTEAE